MLKDYLSQAIACQDFSREEAKAAMQVIMSGQASEAQIGAFLTAMRMKGETSLEVAGFAESMRSQALKVECRSNKIIDTCGTGGDRQGTFNISTAAAFVLAGAGLTVAKHGNRGVSSSCGSADVLNALGIKLELPPEGVSEAIDTIGVGFIFAPSFHQAMKFAVKPRKELGFRTVFNLLGPLTNPAGANCQLIGVYDQALTTKVAHALAELGVTSAMVVHSLDGLDEISTASPTQVAEVRGEEIRSYLIEPEAYGFTRCTLADYQGGTIEENAQIIIRLLNGEQGFKRDIVLLNAAAALVVADAASNIEEGIALAAKSIDSGSAFTKLEALQQFTQNYQNRGELPLL
ncbi:Anthranilate phosphoribosyltransferase [Sporomusa ovata DSM 2662]|uniref:Anthranilate phosphoribosyltransferase n=1 Tax=Sporomusa ovata TaxID=2378 RepID=A0A0U1L3L3_9FIRM|nr:anthranilate phosphoribosyltransferase [Sporomusa ovata]EQB25723.1 anthranilate phosphoribosyltransferase [Sporomusa ovata DSM 2662]CQR74282.1 Anthranilate phosphoribosyltransferase [Sporomusa ovata]